MTYKVRMTDQATSDYNTILDWITERSVSGALHWIDAFDQMIDRIRLHPFAHAPAPENEFREQQVRSAVFGTRSGRRFRALYFLDGDVIVLTHLRDSHQEPLTSEELDET